MMLWCHMIVLLLLLTSHGIHSLENGLARTPPMGWLTWERFRCITDCKTYPDECISEDLIIRTADLMVNDGYLEAGYEYLGIDDCWLEKSRGPYGELVADKTRFPRGMKFIADYLHSKGLKFALYEDYGTKTCAGYPGLVGHEKQDVDTFVSWDVDYIKLDGCYFNNTQMDKAYPAFGKLLNESGRPIVYSCSWPDYQEEAGIKPNYASIAEHCNLWRNWADIDDSYKSVSDIIDWFGDNQDRLVQYAGPGHWNDPDMLIIGNFGLSIDQARTQMSIWAILAAPLMMSVDLKTIRPEFKEILLNKDVIAINQDTLGKQGVRLTHGEKRYYDIWYRELSNNAIALAFVNRRVDGVPYYRSIKITQLGLKANISYNMKDIFNNEVQQIRPNTTELNIRINPSGVRLYKLTPLS